MTPREKRVIIESKLRIVLDGTGPKMDLKSAQKVIDAWFRLKNSAFQGRSPIELIENDYDQLIAYVVSLEKNSTKNIIKTGFKD